MELPKFLVADNSAFPDKIFILHTEYPRFLLDVENDDIEWFEDISEEEDNEEFDTEVANLIEEALDFYDAEMASLDEEE
ncbi:hypothetical protein SAMN05443634_11520 [Chishuiella changwenlii]|jgi:hypothetical protein|uniref:Uncharacterized protein n=1 Tax=Chishuiella changwenlii TaxID=1434701 RepID=A0A1M7CSN5_9FLAO|nr:hypothetical protein [Chishuiella changwenlii]GGE97046.1 hypothetical protein GCM10010984_13170 [Chishuiella changwenlii]SHL70190.1 hypothetical protein SAMN05443634_11520 [Chishuiella changwenlii]